MVHASEDELQIGSGATRVLYANADTLQLGTADAPVLSASPEDFLLRNRGNIVVHASEDELQIGSGATRVLYANADSLQLGTSTQPVLDANSTRVRMGIGERMYMYVGASDDHNTLIGADVVPPASGRNNVAIGDRSGFGATGNTNTMVGTNAGANLMGDFNVAVGSSCLTRRGGLNTVAIGHNAGSAVIYGETFDSVFIGTSAGAYVGTAQDTVIVGKRNSAASESVYVANSVFVGTDAGYGGVDNVGIGQLALARGSGVENVAIGSRAGARMIDGSQNVLVGARAGANVIDAVQNVFLGIGAGNSGSFNTAVGYGAAAAAGGDSNTFLGWKTGGGCVGDDNVYVGHGVASDARGDQNVVVGANTCTVATGTRNVVLGSGSMPSFRGNGCIVVGTGNKVSKPMENALLIGSGFREDTSLRSVSNAVIIGTDITLTNRDSNVVVLGGAGVGDVIRATSSAVSFSTGCITTRVPKTTQGPEALLTERYTRPANASTIPYRIRSDFNDVDTKYTWYDVTTNMRTAFVGPETSPLLKSDGTYMLAVPGIQSNAAPADGGWISYAIPAVRIQGVSYEHAYVHPSGVVCFGNGASFGSAFNPKYGVPTGSMAAASVFGPTIAFGATASGETTWRMSYFVPERPLPPNDDAAGFAGVDANLKSSIVVLRWEKRIDSTYYFAEISILYPVPGIRGTVDNVIRVAWISPNGPDWPNGWDGQSVALLGLDGCVLGHFKTGGVLRSIYFVPRPNPPSVKFSPWVATSIFHSLLDGMPTITHIPLKRRLRWFGGEFTDVYVHPDGRVAFGPNENLTFRLPPLFPLKYMHSVSHLLDSTRQQALPSSTFDMSPVAGTDETRVRLEMHAGGSRFYVLELAFSEQDVTILYTDSFETTNQELEAFIEYQGALYPVPIVPGVAYRITTEYPPHVFAGGKVVLGASGIALQDAAIRYTSFWPGVMLEKAFFENSAYRYGMGVFEGGLTRVYAESGGQASLAVATSGNTYTDIVRAALIGTEITTDLTVGGVTRLLGGVEAIGASLHDLTATNAIIGNLVTANTSATNIEAVTVTTGPLHAGPATLADLTVHGFTNLQGVEASSLATASAVIGPGPTSAVNFSADTITLLYGSDTARKARSHSWEVPCCDDNLLGKQLADKAACYTRVKAAPLHRVTWPTAETALGWVAEDISGVFPEAVRAETLKFVNADQITKALYGAVQHIIQKLEANTFTNAILNGMQ